LKIKKFTLLSFEAIEQNVSALNCPSLNRQSPIPFRGIPIRRQFISNFRSSPGFTGKALSFHSDFVEIFLTKPFDML